MRRFFLMALAISVVMAFGSTSALAAKGGEKGSGKPCPPSSPAGQLNELLPGPDISAPSCGNQKPGGGNGNGNGNTCPPNSPNPGGTPPNCGHPPVEPPEGNCAVADLVLLTEDAKIVCLYLGENAENATKEADCPDALIALPVSPVVGACVFLPPEGDGGLPEVPGLPEM